MTSPSRDRWSRMGYQVLLLGMDTGGLALAPKQFDKIAGPLATDSEGEVFYHGTTNRIACFPLSLRGRSS